MVNILVLASLHISLLVSLQWILSCDGWGKRYSPICKVELFFLKDGPPVFRKENPPCWGWSEASVSQSQIPSPADRARRGAQRPHLLCVKRRAVWGRLLWDAFDSHPNQFPARVPDVNLATSPPLPFTSKPHSTLQWVVAKYLFQQNHWWELQIFKKNPDEQEGSVTLYSGFLFQVAHPSRPACQWPASSMFLATKTKISLKTQNLRTLYSPAPICSKFLASLTSNLALQLSCQTLSTCSSRTSCLSMPGTVSSKVVLLAVPLSSTLPTGLTLPVPFSSRSNPVSFQAHPICCLLQEVFQPSSLIAFP